MTVREALLDITGLLEQQHISNSRLCAEVLLIHVLQVDRTFLYSHDDDLISDEQYAALESAVNRRLNGEPLQYIVRHQEFYGREFIVGPAVLIPRPETEHIIESVLETRPPAESRIIDVGTGSGCIAITLALELPQSIVTAGDISADALKVAKLNANRLGATVSFVCMDCLDAIAGIGAKCGTFDFIVSNPPYVPRGDYDHLQREVRDHEPHLALFSPDESLAIYRRLVRSALDLLKPGGSLIMEVGFGMDQSVMSLLSEGWKNTRTHPDLQGIPRTVVAVRS